MYEEKGTWENKTGKRVWGFAYERKKDYEKQTTNERSCMRKKGYVINFVKIEHQVGYEKKLLKEGVCEKGYVRKKVHDCTIRKNKNSQVCLKELGLKGLNN